MESMAFSLLKAANQSQKVYTNIQRYALHQKF